MYMPGRRRTASRPSRTVMSAASYPGPGLRPARPEPSAVPRAEVALRRPAGDPTDRDARVAFLGGTVLFFANQPPVGPAHGGPSAPAGGPRNGCFYTSDSINGTPGSQQLRIPR